MQSNVGYFRDLCCVIVTQASRGNIWINLIYQNMKSNIWSLLLVSLAIVTRDTLVWVNIFRVTKLKYELDRYQIYQQNEIEMGLHLFSCYLDLPHLLILIIMVATGNSAEFIIPYLLEIDIIASITLISFHDWDIIGQFERLQLKSITSNQFKNSFTGFLNGRLLL